MEVITAYHIDIGLCGQCGFALSLRAHHSCHCQSFQMISFVGFGSPSCLHHLFRCHHQCTTNHGKGGEIHLFLSLILNCLRS